MKRRTFIKSASTAGMAAAGVTVAGCLGESADPADEGGQTVRPEEPQKPGWFIVEGEIPSEYRADALKITESSLFRTRAGFGVLGTVKNTGKRNYTRVVIHAQLLKQGDVVVSETEASSGLGSDGSWDWRIEFENTDSLSPHRANDSSNSNSDSAGENISYEVWATGRVQ